MKIELHIYNYFHIGEHAEWNGEVEKCLRFVRNEYLKTLLTELMFIYLAGVWIRKTI